MAITQKDIGKYIVYANGDIFSKYSNKMLSKGITSNGYEYVALNQKIVKVHRVIANAFIPNQQNLPQVNHINGIKTDNRVENLEWCNHQYNTQHKIDSGLSSRGTKPKSNTSGYVGVSFRKKAKKFYSQIYVKGQYIYLGCFSTALEAAEAYNIASIKYHKKTGKLNDTKKINN